MKIQFKHQKFQTEAASAVCEIFNGQQRHAENIFGGGLDNYKVGANALLELDDTQLLNNLRGVQRKFSLPISERLEGKNFSVEMETGVGKTYTYIKTMYELNRHYGWSKFIIVVPSVAIREGIKKSFEMTEEHFAEEYGEKIRHFVYNSKNLSVIKSFVNDSKIWAMIVNVQAFNSRSKDARRMLQKLDEFNSRIPIEVIAQINPIIIIDEPQSVEGEVAQEKIKLFKPLMTLRYSATHKNLFNLVYRLDALDAYRQRLVKKISVKGIEIRGEINSTGYIFFEAVNLSRKNPTATLTFRRKGKTDTKKITRKISVGDDLYELSNRLDEYQNFVVTIINGAEYSIEFLNGLKLFAGQVIGDIDEDEFRRIQIRETIQSHLEREAQLFNYGIKVLSLFFIDEVAKYRQYDGNNPIAGVYAKIFEEEYAAAVASFKADADYKNYLDSIAAQNTHAGYFSVDKKNRVANSKIDDADAYDLIMRDKETLLDFKTPVRFIFSHSALREGWDNPNVFQICTLKQTSSDIRRRQEVGRGMRLCVNRDGERMDEDKIGEEIHNINVLTVVANESYSTFADGLQKEIAEAVNRPTIAKETYKISNAREDNVEAELDEQKLADKNFLELWDKICRRGFYSVDFDSIKPITAAAEALNKILSAHENYFVVESGTLNADGTFDKEHSRAENFRAGETILTTDLIGELVTETGLTRNDVSEILKRVEPKVISKIKINPEKFIPNLAEVINDAKAAQVVSGISYTATDSRFDIKIFSVANLKGCLNVNAMKTAKNLYDHLIFDSKVEKEFAADLETADDVSVYAKLPKSFYIPTPLGRYTPDWAIVFREKIYFVVETKGSSDDKQLREVERGKISCAEKFFDEVIGDGVKYQKAKDYRELTDFLRRI